MFHLISGGSQHAWHSPRLIRSLASLAIVVHRKQYVSVDSNWAWQRDKTPWFYYRPSKTSNGPDWTDIAHPSKAWRLAGLVTKCLQRGNFVPPGLYGGFNGYYGCHGRSTDWLCCDWHFGTSGPDLNKWDSCHVTAAAVIGPLWVHSWCACLNSKPRAQTQARLSGHIRLRIKAQSLRGF